MAWRRLPCSVCGAKRFRYDPPRMCGYCASTPIPPLVARLYGLPTVTTPQNQPDDPKPLEHDIAAAPIEAWRAWRIVTPTPTNEQMADWYDQGLNPWRKSFEPRLCGIGVPAQWPTDQTDALCSIAPHSGHRDAPHQDCTCGIWAFRDRETLEKALVPYGQTHPPRPDLVIGRVQLWGRVFVCGDVGYRAEHARPLSIIASTDQEGASIAAAYGCDYAVEERTTPTLPDPSSLPTGFVQYISTNIGSSPSLTPPPPGVANISNIPRSGMYSTFTTMLMRLPAPPIVMQHWVAPDDDDVAALEAPKDWADDDDD